MNLAEIFKGPMTPGKWRALGQYLMTSRTVAGPGARVRTVGNQTVISARRVAPGPPGTPPPFWVTVTEGETSGYVARVTRGVVAERRVVEDEDTVGYHVPEGLLEDDGTSKPIAMADGDGLFVIVTVAPGGEVAADGVKMGVEPAEEVKVSHFIPEVADESGQEGTYKYRLGTLTIEDGSPKFEPDMAGSNISHWVDLPRFKKAGGMYDIFKRFDLEERRYKTKGLSDGVRDYDGALRSIEIVDTGDELQFHTAGKDLDLKIQPFKEGTDGRIWEVEYGAEILSFRDGIFVGVFEEGSTPGAMGTVIEKTVSWFTGYGEAP